MTEENKTPESTATETNAEEVKVSEVVQEAEVSKDETDETKVQPQPVTEERMKELLNLLAAEQAEQNRKTYIVGFASGVATTAISIGLATVGQWLLKRNG